MITRHVGGEIVKGGVYWSSSGGEFVSIAAEGGRLEGGPEDRYTRAPLPLVLIGGALMGLAFIVFLPLSGLLVLLPFLAHKVGGILAAGKMRAAQVAGPSLQPGVSYLEPTWPAGTAERESRTEASEEAQAGKLVDLAREIAEKRWGER